MVYFKRVSKNAAFWSISCALATVMCWYALSRFTTVPVFQFDPLWPGLLVSFMVFTLISRSDRAGQ
jgi:Na+/pantothenate symporter